MTKSLVNCPSEQMPTRVEEQNDEFVNKCENYEDTFMELLSNDLSDKLTRSRSQDPSRCKISSALQI